MDSFDDFKLKPLSSGLGFHKKSLDLKQSIKKTKLDKDFVKKQVPKAPPEPEDVLSDQQKNLEKQSTTYADLLAALAEPKDEGAQFDEPSASTATHFADPLPRKEDQKEAMITDIPMDSPIESYMPIAPSLPEIIEDEAPSVPTEKIEKPTPITQKPFRKPESDLTRRGAHDSPVGVLLSPVALSLRSLLLDCIMVFALALLILSSMLWITQVDFASVWFNAKTDQATQISIAILFLAVFQVYTVVVRSFFGRTLGEWTFDCQLGNDKEQEEAFYPLRVLARSFVVVFSGVILMPLISLFVGRDITGDICGVKLYQQRQL